MAHFKIFLFQNHKLVQKLYKLTSREDNGLHLIPSRKKEERNCTVCQIPSSRHITFGAMMILCTWSSTRSHYSHEKVLVKFLHVRNNVLLSPGLNSGMSCRNWRLYLTASKKYFITFYLGFNFYFILFYLLFVMNVCTIELTWRSEDSLWDLVLPRE